MELATFLRLVLAGSLGFLIGVERDRSGHAAGSRTFAAVALGAATFGVVSVEAFDPTTALGANADPSRVASQVVVGIGFLGAGVIIRRGESIKNLTTAAGLWATASFGLAIGLGSYAVGVAAAALTLLLVAGVPLLTDRLERLGHWSRLRLRCRIELPSSPELVRTAIHDHELDVRSWKLSKRDGQAVVDVLVRGGSTEELHALLADLVARPEIATVDVIT